MKLYAYIEPSHFQIYLADTKQVETDQSRSTFLREIGTSRIMVNSVKVGFVEVLDGSCVRLRSSGPTKAVPAVSIKQALWSVPWSCFS